MKEKHERTRVSVKNCERLTKRSDRKKRENSWGEIIKKKKENYQINNI